MRVRCVLYAVMDYASLLVARFGRGLNRGHEW
jgi:hypothetical protein